MAPSIFRCIAPIAALFLFTAAPAPAAEHGSSSSHSSGGSGGNHGGNSGGNSGGGNHGGGSGGGNSGGNSGGGSHSGGGGGWTPGGSGSHGGGGSGGGSSGGGSHGGGGGGTPGGNGSGGGSGGGNSGGGSGNNGNGGGWGRGGGSGGGNSGGGWGNGGGNGSGGGNGGGSNGGGNGSGGGSGWTPPGSGSNGGGETHAATPVEGGYSSSEVYGTPGYYEPAYRPVYYPPTYAGYAPAWGAEGAGYSQRPVRLMLVGDFGFSRGSANISGMFRIEGQQWGLTGNAQGLLFSHPQDIFYQSFGMHLTYAVLTGDSGRLRVEAGVSGLVNRELAAFGPSIGLTTDVALVGPLSLEGSVHVMPLPVFALEGQAGASVGFGNGWSFHAGVRTVRLVEAGQVSALPDHELATGPYAAFGLTF